GGAATRPAVQRAAAAIRDLVTVLALVLAGGGRAAADASGVATAAGLGLGADVARAPTQAAGVVRIPRLADPGEVAAAGAGDALLVVTDGAGRATLDAGLALTATAAAGADPLRPALLA